MKKMEQNRIPYVGERRATTVSRLRYTAPLLIDTVAPGDNYSGASISFFVGRKQVSRGCERTFSPAPAGATRRAPPD